MLTAQTLPRCEVIETEPAPNQDSMAYGLTWAAVFDGLGGHKGSEHASSLAAAAMYEFAAAHDPAVYEGEWSADALEFCRSRLQTARATGEFPHMTCAAAVFRVKGKAADYAWCGDVRVYLKEGWRFTRLSDDHDFLYQQTMTGSGIPVHTARHLRNAISEAKTASDAWRAGGGLAKKAFKKNHIMHSDLSSGVIDTGRVELTDDSLLLLTCDGIHDNYTETEMGAALKEVSSPDVAVNTLMDGAVAIANDADNPRGHGDDLTCIAFAL